MLEVLLCTKVAVCAGFVSGAASTLYQSYCARQIGPDSWDIGETMCCFAQGCVIGSVLTTPYLAISKVCTSELTQPRMGAKGARCCVVSRA